MRVLVTGGAGFIGSHLVRACLQAGDHVRVIDDLSTGKLANLAEVADDVDFQKGSVADFDAIERSVQGCEVVFHQAAIASVPQSVDDPLGSHAVNATGTLHVLEAARRAGVRRVVFAASCAIYGDSHELPKREEMKPLPLSPYALQKYAGESYCGLYTRLKGLDAVPLRYFNVFGPRQDPSSTYAGVIPVFVSALVHGRTPRIHGDGEQSRDFVYVEDIVAANLAAAAAPPAACGQPVNIGRGERVSMNELLATIADAMDLPRPEPEFTPERPGDVRDSQADISRARELLGWEPRTTLREGLRPTADYYRELSA